MGECAGCGNSRREGDAEMKVFILTVTSVPAFFEPGRPPSEKIVGVYSTQEAAISAWSEIKRAYLANYGWSISEYDVCEGEPTLKLNVGGRC